MKSQITADFHPKKFPDVSILIISILLIKYNNELEETLNVFYQT